MRNAQYVEQWMTTAGSGQRRRPRTQRVTVRTPEPAPAPAQDVERITAEQPENIADALRIAAELA